MDRRRLETAHLFYAVLMVSSWYPDTISSICLDDLDAKMMQLVCPYHRAFSEKYARELYYIWVVA